MACIIYSPITIIRLPALSKCYGNATPSMKLRELSVNNKDASIVTTQWTICRAIDVNIA